MPTYERTNKRDLHYSNRHRSYGGLAMMDIDHIEFDGLNASAIIEEKHPNITQIDFSDIEIKRLIVLADKLHVPLFIIVPYFFHNLKLLNAEDTDNPTHIRYFLVPVNSLAKLILPKEADMTERDYVNFLYEIRGWDKPNAINFYNTWRSVCTPEVTR